VYSDDKKGRNEDLTSIQELVETIPSHPLSHPSKSAIDNSPKDFAEYLLDLQLPNGEVL
jgi:hypothetical protein